jgi:hypothetical protein
MLYVSLIFRLISKKATDSIGPTKSVKYPVKQAILGIIRQIQNSTIFM